MPKSKIEKDCLLFTTKPCNKTMVVCVYWSKPCKPPGINRTNHLVIIFDDYTRFPWSLLVKTKDEASIVLTRWATLIFNITKVLATRNQNWWRFGIAKICSLDLRKREQLTISPLYTHKRNGVVEFSGHIIMQSARALMISVLEALAFLWPEAVIASTYILNRIRRPNELEVLIEKWNKALQLRYQDPMDLGHLRV